MAFNPCAAFKAGSIHGDLRRLCTDRPRASSVNEDGVPIPSSAPATPPMSPSPAASPSTFRRAMHGDLRRLCTDRPRSASVNEDGAPIPSSGSDPATPPMSPGGSPINSGRSTPTQWSLSSLALNFEPIRTRASSWSGARPAFLVKRLEKLAKEQENKPAD